jgi:hypothetical protein
MNTRPSWRARLAEFWRNSRRGVGHTSIDFDECALTVTTTYSHASESRSRLQWQNVNGVVACKRDLITSDLICVGFSSPDGGIEVNEEMKGWQAFVEVLPTHLPGVPPYAEWWARVAQPPFATNATKLFSR